MLDGNSYVIVQAAKIGDHSMLCTGWDSFLQSKPFLGVGTFLTFEVVNPVPMVWQLTAYSPLGVSVSLSG